MDAVVAGSVACEDVVGAGVEVDAVPVQVGGIVSESVVGAG